MKKLTKPENYQDCQEWAQTHRSRAQSLRGDFFRVAGPRYTSAEQIVDGNGSLAGGRWNPMKAMKAMKAVYLSREDNTALMESKSNLESIGCHREYPKVIVLVRVEIEKALDLAESVQLIDYPFSLDILLNEDWRTSMNNGIESNSQTLGRVIYNAGFQGVLLPSSRSPGGTNLMVFPGKLTKKSVLKVINPESFKQLGQRT